MGLPDINRARIEKLKSTIEAVEYALNNLEGDFENYDPIVSDEDFPNIIPNAPDNVRATGLFRNIQVLWNYDHASYIAKYQVFASQENGFTPLDSDLIWEGKSGGYNHEASTNETWYFKVRAVNTHGEVSEFSNQATGTTADISGFEIEEKYQIDTIEYANQYTDDREKEIMQEVAEKVGADEFYGELLLKETRYERSDTPPNDTRLMWFDTTDGEFKKYDSSTSTWTIVPDGEVKENNVAFNMNEINLRVTQKQYDDDINDEENGLISRVNTAETEIDQNKSDILLRATQTELDTRMGDVVDRFEVNEASISVNATNIQSKVEQATYDALEDRVDSAETSISQNATDITLKASQTDLDGVEGRLSTAESTITQQADEIELRVEKDGVISSINQSAEELKIDIAQVTIDGDLVVENGLVRLGQAVIDSAHVKDSILTNRMFADNVITGRLLAGEAIIDSVHLGTAIITDGHINGRLSANKLTIGSGTSYASGYDPTTKETPSGAQSKANSAESSAKSYASTQASNAESNAKSYAKNGESVSRSVPADGKWYRIAVNTGNRASARFIIADRTGGTHQTVEFLASAHYNRNPVIDLLHESHYTNRAISDIRLLTNSTYDEMYVDVKTVNSSRSSFNVTLHVYENVQNSGWDVKNFQSGASVPSGYTTTSVKVNQNNTVGGRQRLWEYPNTTKIDGGSIYANSVTANKINVSKLDAISANLGTINAGDITGVNITGANIKQQGQDAYISLTDDGLHLVANQDDITRIAIETSWNDSFYPALMWFEPTADMHRFAIGTNGAGLGDGFVGFTEYHNNRIFNISNNGGTTNIEAGEVNIIGGLSVSSGFIEANAIDTGSTHMYVRANGEVRATKIGTTDDYATFRAGSAYFHGFIRHSGAIDKEYGGGIHSYIRTDSGGEIRATVTGSTSSYVPFRADSFPTSSSEEVKEDIKVFNGNALDIINDSVIYDYNRKANGVRELGFIIEREMPEIVKFDDKSINGYTHRSLNTKAIQELIAEVNSLKEEIKLLKNEN